MERTSAVFKTVPPPKFMPERIWNSSEAQKTTSIGLPLTRPHSWHWSTPCRKVNGVWMKEQIERQEQDAQHSKQSSWKMRKTAHGMCNISQISVEALCLRLRKRATAQSQLHLCKWCTAAGSMPQGTDWINSAAQDKEPNREMGGTGWRVTATAIEAGDVGHIKRSTANCIMLQDQHSRIAIVLLICV